MVRLNVVDTQDNDIEEGKAYNIEEEEAKQVLDLCVSSFMKTCKVTVLKVMEFSSTKLEPALSLLVLMDVEKIYS